MRSQRFGRLGPKVALTVAVGATMALAMTGCSGSVAGNGAAQSGKTVITVWHAATGDTAKTLTKLVDEYNNGQSKYKVELQFDGGGDQLTAKLMNAIKNKQAPQVVLGDGLPQGLGEVVSTGAVVPLDDRLADSASTIRKSDFTAGLLSTGTFSGKTYSLPTDVGDYAVLYNKQMFAEAGITSVPTTWAEFEADAKKLTKGTTQYGAYLPIGGGEWSSYLYEAMLWSAGGELLNADNTKAEFNSPAGLTALKAWTDMIDNGSAYPQSLATATDGSGTPGITAKKVAMEINGAWNIPVLDQALGKDNVGAFALPAIDQPGMNLGTDNSFILKGTQAQEDGGWDFLQYWLKPSTEATWDVATGFFPANSRTAENPAWQKYLAANPRTKVFVDELAYAKARPSIAQYGAVSTALSNELEKALLKKESPQTALTNAEANANKALK